MKRLPLLHADRDTPQRPSRAQEIIYALPSLTRTGAAVLPTPPDVLLLLRSEYQRVLARVAAGDEQAMLDDPTNLQRDESGKSPIFDGDHLDSPHSKPKCGTVGRRVVEWAAIPEAVHAQVRDARMEVGSDPTRYVVPTLTAAPPPRTQILSALQPMLESWCGHALVPVRFFGVRRCISALT